MSDAEVTRITGVVFDNPTGNAIDLDRITREVAGHGGPCCDACGFVRASVSVVAVARLVDVATTPLLNPPDASKPNVVRHVPYIKARVSACDPVMRPLFMDVGQSLVVPWCKAAIALLVPPNDANGTWVLNPPLDVPIPLVGGGGRNVMYDVWLWQSLHCTSCCPDKTATLTDSLQLAANATNVLIVPPGAKRATISVRAAGGDFFGIWQASADPAGQPIGTFGMGSAAFADFGPKNFHVVPGATHLRVSSNVVTQLTVAWEVQP